MNGLSNKNGTRLLIITHDRMEFEYALRFKFKVSNNEEKYETLLASMHLTLELRAEYIVARIDSEWMVNQMNKEFQYPCNTQNGQNVKLFFPL